MEPRPRAHPTGWPQHDQDVISTAGEVAGPRAACWRGPPGAGGRPGAPAPQPPGSLDEHADRQRQPQGEQQAKPLLAFEDLAAEPAEEERVAGPHDPRAGSGGDEFAPGVPDQAAGESYRGAPAGNSRPGL